MKTIMTRITNFTPTKYTNPNNFEIPYHEEIWSPYININGKFTSNYSISTTGRIYSKITNKYLKGTLQNNGYVVLDLSTEWGLVNVLFHRVMMMTFNPVLNMDELEINHKNGIKSCNDLFNLEWSTRILNSHHSQLLNTTIHTLEDSIKVCNLRMQCKSIKEICTIMNWEYKIYGSVVKNIIDNYKNKYNFPIIKSTIFNEKDVNRICKLRIEKKSIEEIIEIMGLENNITTKNRIRCILRGDKWSNIVKNYKIPQIKDQSTISNNTIEKVCRLYFIECKNIKNIMDELKLDYNNRSINESVRQICRGKTYKKISSKYIKQSKRVE